MRRALAIVALLTAAALHAHGSVLRLNVNDMIHPISDEFIGRAIEQAQSEHDDAVILVLSTPGGLLDSTRSIVEKIMTSRIPVIVYVAPAGSRAASAGFFILESADVAAMAPGTNTGAAHPVLLGETTDEVMKAKMENDAAAFMRTIAAKRGRNVTVAESAVRESKSFTEQEALSQKLIDVIAPTEQSLLRALDGRTFKRYDGTSVTLRVANAQVKVFEMSLRQRLMSSLMDPNIAFLLLALGALALFAEFNHPGAVVPGVVGVISIVLALFALNFLPTRFASLALLLVAFALFALEAKFSSHGVLAAGGIVCMVIGALFLVDGPIPQMRVNIITAVAVSVPIGIIAVFLTTLVLRARRGRVSTGSEGMIGEIGIARTPLGLEGKVFVHGELWNAVSATAIAEGARVRVAGVNGLHLVVEPAE
ncbi:MAG TPA: nodulation protein NfeD [Thermoanaerobaculia bacterium]|jgi:membrane-bound serine protease (ClpP class)|nr:nodulation protein NfeD [Thermoanaerobaculia bacterium]